MIECFLMLLAFLLAFFLVSAGIDFLVSWPRRISNERYWKKIARENAARRRK